MTLKKLLRASRGPFGQCAYALFYDVPLHALIFGLAPGTASDAADTFHFATTLCRLRTHGYCMPYAERCDFFAAADSLFTDAEALLDARAFHDVAAPLLRGREKRY